MKRKKRLKGHTEHVYACFLCFVFVGFFYVVIVFHLNYIRGFFGKHAVHHIVYELCTGKKITSSRCAIIINSR